MAKRDDVKRVVVKLDFSRPFPRPLALEGLEPTAAVPVVIDDPLEFARQILRGVHSGMVELRRNTEVAWECPAANFGLMPLTDQLAAGLAVLEDIRR